MCRVVRRSTLYGAVGSLSLNENFGIPEFSLAFRGNVTIVTGVIAVIINVGL